LEATSVFVRTVTGDHVSHSLGFTHCHEHLFVFQSHYTNLQKRLILDDFDKTKMEVIVFRKSGGGTIVDAQPFGAGRHPLFLNRLSRETGVRIIASTGLHKRAFYKPDFWSLNASSAELAALFISEIEEGMYVFDLQDLFGRRCDIRAGIIKIASDEEGITSYYTKVFDAAVHAHRETGAPIMTHTELSKDGMEQAEYLIDKGVGPRSIIISHMDRVIDIERNLNLARLGVFLQYDTIARPKYHSDEDEVTLIGTLVQKGCSDRILLGMDSTRRRFLSYDGTVGLDFLKNKFISMLKRSGIGEEHIELMTRKNPQAALSFRNGGEDPFA
jgi:phosphotriesterase-related protein